jgi:hypothetical protein
MYTECLRADGVKLPKEGFLAFSASTGAAFAEHDLLSVTTATFSGASHHNSSVRLVETQSEKGQLIFILGVSGALFYLCSKYIIMPMMTFNARGKRDAFSTRMNKIYGSL